MTTTADPQTDGRSDGTPAPRPLTATRPRTPRQRWARAIQYVLLGILALIYLSPILFMLSTSFKTGADAAGIPPSWIPNPFTTQAYGSILTAEGTPVLRWFANSMIAAALHSLLVVVTAALAAYPLARMRFRGRGVVFAIVVATILIPPVILVIPNYLIVSGLGWLNTLVAIIVPTAASAFGVFFLRQFFLSLPVELEEAALIDGANRWEIFLRVILPLSRPALATLALLAFLTNWNDFLWPVYVLFTADVQTLPAGLATLQSANAVRYDLLMAGAVIASIPVLALFVFLQRFIIEGVSRSGLKG
ncbi:carbohydrate ABC transporter permease [Microbacterium sp. 179-I 3D3 NHS]|uniref:carbohydrate ABC transporter permease n=1 Tax=unclassified Microbacterium TaxID=2609290 RepID=UPI0039A272F0